MAALKNIYPYANTIVCIEDSRLLKQINYDILHNAAGLQATLDELNDINYFQSHQTAQPGNFGAMLDSLMKTTFDLIRSVSPVALIWRIFALYYDVHNMKLVVKERFFGKRLDDLAIDYGSYSLPTIRSAAVRKSDDILRNDVLTEGLFQALGLKQSYDIDFVLDKLYFTALKVLVAKLEIPALDRFITEKIDLFNVSMIFQAISSGIPEGYVRRAFSEGGSLPYEDWERYLNKDRPDELLHFTLWQKYRPIWSGTRNRDQALAELDVRIDNYLIDKTKRCKLMAFGIEPICAYFFNKLMEIKNIRILLEGKAKSYDPAEIRKRMRIPYEI